MNKIQRILWLAVAALVLSAPANVRAYSYCGGDPVNNFDPDGRCAKGAWAGWNSSPVPANATQAFMAGYYGGGVANGFSQGANEGVAIEANTFTFRQVDGLNTYANSLQGGVYDFTRGASYVAVGSLSFAGGAALYGTPAVFNAGVTAAYNPWTPVVGAGLIGAADAYYQGAGPGGVVASGVLTAGFQYSQNPFPISFGGGSSSPSDQVLFGQRRIGDTFSTGDGVPSYLSGRPISDVAADLQSGALSPNQLPVQTFQYNDQTVTINNRTLAALSEAGMQPTVVNMTTPTPNQMWRLFQTPIINSPIPGPQIPVTPSQSDLTVTRIIQIPP